MRILKSLLIVFAVTAFSVAGAAELAPLSLSEAASGFSITEDGSFVVVAHEAANKITVWDVKAGKVAATVECPSPKFILCRGDKFYVANGKEGTITVINSEWKAVQSVPVGVFPLYYLSAPGGKFFANKIIACGGKYNEYKFAIVDLEAKKIGALPQMYATSLATSSYDGKIVIDQSEFSHSPSGVATAYDGKAFFEGRLEGKQRGAHRDTPYLYQVAEGGFWFADGCGTIFNGLPVERFGREFEHPLIPDLLEPRFYIVTGGTISAYSIGMNSTLIGKAALTFKDPKASVPTSQRREGPARHPIAVTLDGVTHVFVLTNNIIYYAAVTLEAVEKAPISNPEEWQKVTLPEAPKPAPGTGKPLASAAKKPLEQTQPAQPAQGTARVGGTCQGSLTAWTLITGIFTVVLFICAALATFMTTAGKGIKALMMFALVGIFAHVALLLILLFR